MTKRLEDDSPTWTTIERFYVQTFTLLFITYIFDLGWSQLIVCPFMIYLIIHRATTSNRIWV